MFPMATAWSTLECRRKIAISCTEMKAVSFGRRYSRGLLKYLESSTEPWCTIERLKS